MSSKSEAQRFWMKPKQVTIRDGTKVTLRPETVNDLETVWQMFSTISIETQRYLPIPATRERVESWFSDIDYTKVLPILGSVETSEGTRVIASATLQFHQLDAYKHRAEFGITVHDDYQNKGLGTILTRYMLDIAREHGLKKVDLKVVSHNARAIHVYEKQGFQKEGLQRMNHWNRILAKYGDEYHMGKILE